jgi:hypothetical protein
MSSLTPSLNERLKEAVKHFWTARETQAEKHRATSEERDRGRRSAVTGGKQMDGFASLVRDLLIECGFTRLVPERLYVSAYLLLSGEAEGVAVGYKEPSAELSFRNLATSLLARAIACVKTQ